ncbi:MAG: DUF58 domain-containing protein [Flavobacteriales bacterium]|jgi:uncharacterized protein (DUF58 family)|nr:DUF58 domain-containing protein [Flavobacteriales bacterium]
MKFLNSKYLHELGSIDFIAQQLVEGFMSGRHKSPYHGFSVEFAEHRLYNPGDSMKHVDWKLYGKTDKLYLKKYEAETNLKCKIILDTSSSMFYPIKKVWSLQEPNKYLYSIYAIASLIELMKRQRDAFGVSLLGEEIELNTPSKNLESHQYFLYEQLEKNILAFGIEEKKNTHFSSLLQKVIQQQGRRSVIFIFSDLMFDTSEEFEAFFTGLEFAKFQGHEVTVFHTLDYKEEVDFNLDAEQMEVFALESNQKIKLDLADIQNKYQKKMQAHLREIKGKIQDQGVNYFPVDINNQIDDVLMAYLMQR